MSLSQGVYTPVFAEGGQVERVQPLSRHTCVNVYVCLCSSSNLEAAGGYSLFDMIDSLCSLLAARREPVNILPHAPRFIFHDLATASILWANPSPSPSHCNHRDLWHKWQRQPCFLYNVVQLTKRKKEKKKKEPNSSTANLSVINEVSFTPRCKVSLEKTKLRALGCGTISYKRDGKRGKKSAP